MASNTESSVKLSPTNMQTQWVASRHTAARSTTTSHQSQDRGDSRQQGTSLARDVNARSQSSRAGGPTELASIAPSIPSWLSKLPSEVSGYSSTEPSDLVSPQAQPNAAPRPTSFRPIPARSPRAASAQQASRPSAGFPQEGKTGVVTSTRGSVTRSETWNDEETIGEGSSISQRSSKRQTSTAHETPSVYQMNSAHQTPTVYQNRLMQQVPAMQQFAGTNGQAPVVNNFHYSYSPVDSRQNITTNKQKYHTDNSYRRNTNTPHTVLTHNNQRHIVDNSRLDAISQSMDTLHLNSSYASTDERVSAPSESIPLRRPIMKCKRGLFFNKGITTHKHVPYDRPC